MKVILGKKLLMDNLQKIQQQPIIKDEMFKVEFFQMVTEEIPSF